MQMVTDRLIKYLHQPTSAAPLIVFRILFGLMMLWSTIRFWYHGWIEKLYLAPTFHFKYYGFDFVQVPGQFTYLLFILMAICAVGIMLGFKYRWSIIGFFVLFTYIELMDKTTYLNHYYFISVLSFILLFLDPHVGYSIDHKVNLKSVKLTVAKWQIDAIKLMVGIVYCYAGIAKLNADWMLDANPLAIWLPSKFEVPIIGNLMHEAWLHYAFSWSGAIYDICIVFFLMNRKTRGVAFFFVVVFHLLTRVLFPIGMFPYIMIFGAMIFFSSDFHQKLLTRLDRFFKSSSELATGMFRNKQYRLAIVGGLLAIQLILPWRYLAYPGNLFWTEEGYRFSWRVMLMEKAGYAQFTIVDGISKKKFAVQNDDFLTSFQIKQMATQPDFIIEYAHYLGEHFTNQGHQNVEVYVESYVALNGRKSRPFIDPSVNLMTIEESFRHKTWILPFDE